MNLMTGERADDFFGGEVPASVRALLHRAADVSGDARASLLWTAQSLAPECLACYYALYKHHAGRREFALAERAAWRGLREAARQCGLGEDWRSAAPPPQLDFQQQGPQRFWLFTLKALAFIHLRSDRPEEARELLARIDALDPQARIGTDVTELLLAAARPWPG